MYLHRSSEMLLSNWAILSAAGHLSTLTQVSGIAIIAAVVNCCSHNMPRLNGMRRIGFEATTVRPCQKRFSVATLSLTAKLLPVACFSKPTQEVNYLSVLDPQRVDQSLLSSVHKMVSIVSLDNSFISPENRNKNKHFFYATTVIDHVCMIGTHLIRSSPPSIGTTHSSC